MCFIVYSQQFLGRLSADILMLVCVESQWQGVRSRWTACGRPTVQWTAVLEWPSLVSSWARPVSQLFISVDTHSFRMLTGYSFHSFLPSYNFTTRRHACAVYAVVLCLSVCLSDISQCFIKTAKRSMSQAPPHKSASTPVSSCKRSRWNSNGVTPTEAANSGR